MGELAALATAFLWSWTSVFFTIAGRQIGSVAVNRLRLLLAVILLGITHWVTLGVPFPTDASTERWFWLGLSGLVGLVLGDALLFQAFVMIGPRLSMLLMALVPVMSTALAWATLQERLAPIELLGVLTTVAGVAWVVLEGGAQGGGGEARRYGLGVLVGLGGALGQALGLVAAKRGLGGGFPALSAVMIRMLVAGGVMWLWAGLRGRWPATLKAFKVRPAVWAVLGGSLVGPYLGVWMSLVAIDRTRVGIASTLMSLTPILLIPIVRWVFKERVSWRAALGTGVAVIGVGLLFLG